MQIPLTNDVGDRRSKATRPPGGQTTYKSSVSNTGPNKQPLPSTRSDKRDTPAKQHSRATCPHLGDEVIYCAASASCDRGRRSYRLGDRGAHSEPAVRAAWAEEPLGRPGFDLARCAKRGSRSAAANQRDRYGRRHEPAARVRQRVRDEFRWAGFATDLLGVYGSFQCNRPGMVDERGAHEHAKDPAASDAAGSQLYQHCGSCPQSTPFC